MALQKTRVQRNLKARLRWFVFEIEDLVLLGFVWAGTELVSSHLQRTVFGLPAETILPWMAALLVWLALRLFKYGKPPAYLIDFWNYHRKPKIYCALEPDPQPARRYFKEDNE
jgi:hypothetical protein